MIYWVPSQNENPTVKQYLDFNQIEYTVWDEKTWVDEKCKFILPKNKFFLIMPYDILKSIDLDSLANDLRLSDGVIYFCSRYENTASLNVKKCEKYFSKLENVYLHADCISHNFNPGQIATTDLFTWSGVLDVNATKFYSDTDRNRDFVLTMISKTPERQKLAHSLQQKNLLRNYAGSIVQEHEKYSKWTGMHTNSQWPDGGISWDLYNCVNYELVPEHWDDWLSLLTEKIFKPIVAHIPFIVFSNENYYNLLHTTGFETFDGIIDESFGSEHNLDKRINTITDTMLELDPKEFYSSSREICRHNYNNLCVQHHRSKLEFQDQLHEFLTEHTL